MARITLKSVMNSLMRPSDKRIIITTVASLIGDNLEFALKSVILDHEFPSKKKDMMDMLRRQGRLGDEDEIRKVMESLAAELISDHEDWSNREKLEIGYTLLGILSNSTAWLNVEGYGDEKQELKFSDFFLEIEESTFNFAAQRPQSKKTFKLTKQGVQWLEENEEFMKSLTISFLPMVEPPLDWTIDRGGFDDHVINSRYTLMKGMSNKKLNELYEKYPDGFDTLIKTINIAQKVPFKINDTVFNAIKRVNDEKINLDRKGIPTYKSAWEEVLGSADLAEEYYALKKAFTYGEDKKLTTESWELYDEFIARVVPASNLMSKEDSRKEWFVIKDRVRDFKRSESSKRILVDTILHEAEQFLGEDIYFCYNADFRGRIYPISGLFSPQGSDTSKGMLEFAEPVQVTSHEAVNAIAFQVANSFGIDKVSIDDRVEWTWDNSLDILACAEDPFVNTLWMKADKPFLFLLGCIEWVKVFNAHIDASLDPSKSPLDFETTLPISFDGSVNGIQHFSALLRDKDGAEHVNLTSQDVPADAYQVIADKAKIVASEGTKSQKELIALDYLLDGKLFNRKMTKRATMTLNE